MTKEQMTPEKIGEAFDRALKTLETLRDEAVAVALDIRNADRADEDGGDSDRSTLVMHMTFAELAQVCRRGDARKRFRVGDQIVAPHPRLGSILWDIVEIYTYKVVLQMHYAMRTFMPFDRPSQANRWGSNKWMTSSLRKWLNDPEGDGFLSGWDEDDIDAIDEQLLDTETEDEGVPATTMDRIYLLSTYEVFDMNGRPAALSYYRGHPERRRKTIVDSGNEPTWWWLRSPSPGYTNDVRLVSPDGTLNSNGANNAYAVAAACTIG